MLKAWDLFYNDEYKLLQKNIVKNNDLFVNPIDISDNNIPNGTFDMKDDKDNPSKETPAFAKANNGIIPNAT